MHNLSPEQIKRFEACSTPEELMGVIDEEGVELSAEQLESVAGGVGGLNIWGPCPVCGSDSVLHVNNGAWRCLSCGAKGDPLFDLDPGDFPPRKGPVC